MAPKGRIKRMRCLICGGAGVRASLVSIRNVYPGTRLKKRIEQMRRPLDLVVN